jgi:hypothetical protein
VKKFFYSMLIVVFLSSFQSALPDEQTEDVFLDVLGHLKELNIQTGDLLLWSTNEIDSMFIQKFTEGSYSHAGVLSVDADGKILIYDVYPGQGLRKSYIENHFGLDQGKLVSMAVIRYKGTLDRDGLVKRLDQFWARKNQIQFDQSMALEEGDDYGALLNGKSLSLYCTEFIFRLYEGIYQGTDFFENDYPRVYMKKDIFQTVPWDSEIFNEFGRWMGVRPVEQFQKWLTSHKSQVLICANGMLRAGGFEVLYEKQDKTRLKPWGMRLLEISQGDTAVSTNS